MHYIDEGVDTGDVLATGSPSTLPEDNEATVTARSTRLAAHLTSEVLAAAQWGRLPGLQQSTEIGREFRDRQRTGWKELWYLAQREIVGHRPLPMIKRSECHFVRADDDSDAELALEQTILSEVHELRREVQTCRDSDHAGNLQSPGTPADSSSVPEARRDSDSASGAMPRGQQSRMCDHE